MTTGSADVSSRWLIAAMLFCALITYALSYAPVVRMQGGWTIYRTTDGFGNPATVRAPVYADDLPLYKPVDWLIDNTLLRDPLLWWADVWGVSSPFREAMMWRR